MEDRNAMPTAAMVEAAQTALGHEAVYVGAPTVRRALSAALSIAIKPLTWVSENPYHSARTDFGHYSIEAVDYSVPYFELKGTFIWPAKKYPTFEEAKSAAQSDYDQRIRSALALPLPVQEPEPAPSDLSRGSECQYSKDEGIPEHRCAVRCIYEEKGFAAGIEQAARVAERYDETDTLTAPKAIAAAIRASWGQP